VLAVIVLWFPFAVGIPLLRPVDTAVTAFLLAISIGWLVGNPGSAASRLLSSAPLVTIGLLSYSLYLWQELFLGPHFAWWSLPALAMVSSASYWFVERPALRLRNRAINGLVAEPNTMELKVGTS
jgi:peptidoglycan/LPS O-acetylase OafA/YrhL